MLVRIVKTCIHLTGWIFFRNWDQVYDNTRLVYWHGLNNPDHKGFYYLQSDHFSPTLALTACRNQVGYPEVEFLGVLDICKHSLITECQVVRAKEAYNDYSKEQFIRRTYNMSYNDYLDHTVQHLIQI